MSTFTPLADAAPRREDGLAVHVPRAAVAVVGVAAGIAGGAVRLAAAPGVAARLQRPQAPHRADTGRRRHRAPQVSLSSYSLCFISLFCGLFGSL